MLERYISGADYPVEKNFRIERAISLAIAGDTDAAMDLMEAGDGGPSTGGRTRGGWALLVEYLPEALRSDVLQHKALPRAKGRERHWLMGTLASLNPWVVIGQPLDNLLDPHTFATVLQLVNESVTDSALRDHIKTVVEHRVAEAPANEALLLWWAASRTSLVASSEVRPLRPEYELLWSRLAGDHTDPILEACDTIEVEPAVFLAAWVYDQPTRLPRAVRAIIGRFRDGDVGALLNQVDFVVAAAAHADAVATNSVIDDIDWGSAPVLQRELLRDQSYRTLIQELLHRNRDAAYSRASAIRDPSEAEQALAALAAASASQPRGEPGPTLADILTTAHSGVLRTIEFARNLTTELTWIGHIEPHAMVTLLAETSSWPVSDSTWLFGPLFSLLRQDLKAASEAADALLASASTRNVTGPIPAHPLC